MSKLLYVIPFLFVGCSWVNSEIKVKQVFDAEQLGFDSARAGLTCNDNPFSQELTAAIESRAEWHKGYVKYLNSHGRKCNCLRGFGCQCGGNCRCRSGAVGDLPPSAENVEVTPTEPE